MNIYWFIVFGVSILAIALVVFLIKRNLKDEKELETFLNNEGEIENIEEDEVNNPT
ncbi:MAG: hypothetical protein IM568_10040 [Flavobacterium sp.]|nr:hypothetical protein [Flavobacterium sp.]